jgi:alginate O-acetyltransferase complex protein AlgI
MYILSFGFLGILHAYMDISAWTDISIGISRLLGYNIPENMDRPLLAKNIVNFWQRYHMTIVKWVKEYIFSPLLFLTRNPIYTTFLTMLFMGMWHKPNFLWLLWAIGHSAGIITCAYWQKLPIGKFLAAQFGWKGHIIGVLSWGITFLYMSLIFAFIQCENLTEACKVYSKLFH